MADYWRDFLSMTDALTQNVHAVHTCNYKTKLCELFCTFLDEENVKHNMLKCLCVCFGIKTIFLILCDNSYSVIQKEY